MARPDRPNILFVMSDEHGAWASGAYGNPLIRTPNLDSLARRGVVFDSAYCNSPLCGPSRASLMSGQLPHRMGVLTNSTPMRSDIPTWAHYLSRAGYQTVLAGKQHFAGPDQKHGFELRMGEEVHTPRIRPCSMAVTKNRDHLPGYFQGGPGRTKYMDHDDEVTANVRRFLGGELRDPTRPFALCASYFLPHFPFVATQTHYNFYYPAHAAMPHVPPGYLDQQHPAWKALRAFYGMDDLDSCAMERARAAYFGMCTHMDEQIGHILAALEQSGLAEDTIVVYTSDHGEHLGTKGLWLKKTFFEESVRVPLIVSWPGHFPEGERRSQVLSLVDLAATLVDWGSGERPYEMDGHSFAPLVVDPGTPWVDLAISEFVGVDEALLFPELPIAHKPRRMVRAGRYKLNYFVGEPPELYDMAEDPGEWQNLAADPKYRSVVQALSTRATADWNPDSVLAEMDRSIRRCSIIMEAESTYLGQVPKPLHLK